MFPLPSKILNYINGELTEPISKNYIPNINPSIGKEYAILPDSDKADVESAVQAAERAFPYWSTLSHQQRFEYLIKIADLIDKKLDFLAYAESIDNGKPLKLAKRVDIPRASSNFRFFATAILHYYSQAHINENKSINYTYKQPIGIAGCISPWNLPLYLFTWKVAPALAAGCTVVAKPSEITPLTAYLLSEICIEVGLPKGVLNIVHGYGHKVGQSIVEHPKIKAISFTGGTKTGKQIASTAAPMFKKLSLELGGKNPNIIFADCNYEKMLKTTIQSSFANQGQICLCGSRIFIERTIYDKFKDDFIKKTKQLKVGPPLNEDTQIGAVVSEAHMNKILSYIELARQEGGTILCGGNRVILPEPYNNGYYIQPTIIEGLAHTCRTNQEEIFGPVVTLIPFDTEEEVITMANSVEYGLSATIWTENLNRAHQVAHRMESGIVWINTWLNRDLRTPFGGMKASGIGREGGFKALDFFNEDKNICIELN